VRGVCEGEGVRWCEGVYVGVCVCVFDRVRHCNFLSALMVDQ
jgi:hypothetical protein